MCVQFFHMVSIDVPAGVGAPQLNTTAGNVGNIGNVGNAGNAGNVGNIYS